MKYNILLAGANGNIGSFIFEKFDKEYAITRLAFTQRILKENYFSLDLTNELEVASFSKNIPKHYALIFLVGVAHKKGKNLELDEFRRINKQTLVNLLSSLELQGKLPDKIIFSSTISVYGEKINQNIYNEESDKNPFSPYAVTKLEAEKFLLEHYAKQSWILRFAPVYSLNFQLNINRRTKSGYYFYKVGNGMNKLSLCNIENIGFAIKGILESRVPAGIYNISDENEYSYNELLKYVNAKWIVFIPVFLVKGLYYIGKMMNNIFLKENAIKLISDNIFPAHKIRQHTELTSKLNDYK